LILCDIGNCTFSFYFTNSKKNAKYSINKPLPSANKLQKLDNISSSFCENKIKIYFISVNTKAIKKLQKTYGKKHTINLYSFVGNNSKYTNLGIDRAIICANINNKIIIDAGSAISIDIVKNNSHLGGYIFLGLNAHIKAYLNISKKLKVTTNFAKYKDTIGKIPNSTQDALHLPLLQSVVELSKKLSKKHKLDIITTGGDGLLLSACFKNKKTKYKKNLIFKCMRKVIATNKL